MKKNAVFALLFLMILPGVVFCEKIIVSYLERPPYYETVGGVPSGFLVDLTLKIMDDAGIDYQLREMPPKRIILELKSMKKPHCSIGWFRKKERFAYAKYSKAIYINKPIEVLTTKRNIAFIKNYRKVRELFKDRTLCVGLIGVFSYGEYIDALIDNIIPNYYELPNEQNKLPRLIYRGRISYMLVAPEEIDHLLKSSGLRRDAFVSFRMEDIPKGNKRYLIFNKVVSDETINRINISIAKYVDTEKITRQSN